MEVLDCMGNVNSSLYPLGICGTLVPHFFRGTAMKLLTLLASIVLVGCATTPKPELSDADYTKYSTSWVGLNYCNSKGWISPELAASGKRILISTIQRYSYNAERFDREASYVDKRDSAPTTADCNTLAMHISEQKQRTDSINQANAYNQQQEQAFINSTKSVNTYCNKIGAQTFCNSY